MDLVRALKFPLDDEDWPVKIAIGSLVTLIPVVGWWVVKPAIAVSAVVAFGKAADLFYRRKAQGVDSPIERLLHEQLG